MNALPQVSEMQRRQAAGQGATKQGIQGTRRTAVAEKKKGQLTRANWPFVVTYWQNAPSETTSAHYAAEAAAKLAAASWARPRPIPLDSGADEVAHLGAGELLLAGFGDVARAVARFKHACHGVFDGVGFLGQIEAVAKHHCGR